MSTPTEHPLRELRHAAGLSIRELERRSGINRGRLSHIERGMPATPEESESITRVLVEAIREPKDSEWQAIKDVAR